MSVYGGTIEMGKLLELVEGWGDARGGEAVLKVHGRKKVLLEVHQHQASLATSF